MFVRTSALSLTIMLLYNSPTYVRADDLKVVGPKGGGPSSLIILFNQGSSRIRPEDQAILDRASRTFNEGKPLVMIISGSSDRTGRPRANLALSQQRATAVLHGLLDRGIPADRFQVLAKGETDLAIPTAHGVAEKENRRVVISWH